MAAVIVIVVIVALVGLIVLPFYLVDRRRSRRRAMLPLLADVGDRSGGALACPVCGSTSFQPSGERSFSGIAVFFFVFGSIRSDDSCVECVVCATEFLRGVPTRALDRQAT